MCWGTVCLAAEVRTTPSGKFILPDPEASSARVAPSTSAEAKARLEQVLDKKQVRPGVYQVGEVRLDVEARTVTLPARVNMREHVIEYALVTEEGKRHESLLTTSVRPEEVHLACLLLGVEPRRLDRDREKGTNETIGVLITWERNGPPARHDLSELLLLSERGPGLADPPRKAFPAGGWVYNGSFFDRFGFVASRESSLISLIQDPAALVNHTGPNRFNDDAHEPNPKRLPPVDTPVRVVLTFPPREERRAPVAQ
jgi:hypothetical protein